MNVRTNTNKHRAKFGKQWRPSCLVTSNSTVCLSQHVSNIPISDWQQYGFLLSVYHHWLLHYHNKTTAPKKHKNRGLIWIFYCKCKCLENWKMLRPLHLPWFLLSQFERCKTLQVVLQVIRANRRNIWNLMKSLLKHSLNMYNIVHIVHTVQQLKSLCTSCIQSLQFPSNKCGKHHRSYDAVQNI